MVTSCYSNSNKKIFPRPFLLELYLDDQLKCQITAMLLAFFTLTLVFIVAPTSFSKYFALGNISAHDVPVPLVGISPTSKETWLQIGANFAFIITTVTFIYFQLIKGKKIKKTTSSSLLLGSHIFFDELIYRRDDYPF